MFNVLVQSLRSRKRVDVRVSAADRSSDRSERNERTERFSRFVSFGADQLCPTSTAGCNFSKLT